MIAYNTTTLNAIQVIKKAKQWYARRLLTTEQFAATERRYPVDFYTPNLFVKVGLFLFSWVLAIAAAGLLALMFSDAFSSTISDALLIFICLLFATGCVFMLEVLIREKKLYRSGIDEALLYAALIAIGCAIATALPGAFGDTNGFLLSFSLLMLPVLAAAGVRYGDGLVALGLELCLYTVVFGLVLKLGSIAKVIMPFVFMLLSGILYVAATRLQRQYRFRHWHIALSVFEATALAAGYAAGNYYVIREAAAAFFGQQIAPGHDIPFAPFFYLYTAVVPLLYLFAGLRHKNRLILWVALAAVAAAAITFKYYFSLGHPEIILTLAGACLIAVAYASIRYLKTPRHGLTFEPDPDEDGFLLTNAEALLQARTSGPPPPAPVHRTEFGGGSGGGGGATSNW